MDSDPIQIDRICVYCASSTGSNAAIVDAATQLGLLLAEADIELVYGGGSVGLMGVVADTVMAGGGRVTGIIPTGLFPSEIGHQGISELIEVADMHARKAEMMRRADAFVALPGGFGTLEELSEVLTWAQLGIHTKPVGLLNVDGFYDDLLRFLDRCVSDRILKDKNRALLQESGDPADLLHRLRTARPATEPKWLDEQA